VLEAGCGDGRLTRRLAVHHPCVIGLDRTGPVVTPGLIADAGRPPLRRSSTAVVVMGNVYRHLDDGVAVLERWRRVLSAGGCLWILEDEPAAGGAPGRLYCELQALLDEIVPGRRGRPLSLDAFRGSLGSAKDWSFGRERNREDSANLDALMAGLEAHGAAAPAASRIAARIRAEGLDYGHYWWARWRPGESS